MFKGVVDTLKSIKFLNIITNTRNQNVYYLLKINEVNPILYSTS